MNSKGERCGENSEKNNNKNEEATKKTKKKIGRSNSAKTFKELKIKARKRR